MRSLLRVGAVCRRAFETTGGSLHGFVSFSTVPCSPSWRTPFTHARKKNTGGGEPVASAVLATFLVRVFECDQTAADASRRVLDGVDEVRFERGERRPHYASSVRGPGSPFSRAHLPDSVSRPRTPARTGSRAPASARASSLSAEDRAIREALTTPLRDTRGNVTETARSLGKARQQIQRWLRRFELDPEQFR